MADAEAHAKAAAEQAKQEAALLRKAAEDPTEIHVVLDAEFEKKNFLKVHQKLTFVYFILMFTALFIFSYYNFKRSQ